MTSGETITFSFELTQPGAALAVFVFEGVENEFELTNVCNPLGDMLSAMAAMVTNPSQLWEGENTAGFIWYCESESYNWTLTAKKGGRLEIRITQSCEFFGDDEVEIVKGRAKAWTRIECRKVPRLALGKHCLFGGRGNIPTRPYANPCATAIPDRRLVGRLDLHNDHITIRERKRIDCDGRYRQYVAVRAERGKLLQKLIGSLKPVQRAIITNAN